MMRLAQQVAAVGLGAALLAGPLPAAAAGPQLFHVPADLFAATGALGALQLDACRIILADGPGGSQLRVSPGMARLGFRDIAFTVPALQREVAFGPLATTLRLRIPGRDPAAPATTIQSTRLALRIAGTSVELSAAFESQGPELIAEYYAADPRTGAGSWAHALDVEADDLRVTVAFPIQAAGAALVLGSPRVTADFSFAVAASGWAGLALDDTFAKGAVKAEIEGAIAKALDLEAYRAPLAATITTWLSEGPFKDLPLKEIRVQPAPDGGLDLLGVTAADR
jgi:hypothetical protein